MGSRRRRRPFVRTQAGSTLIEVLISIVIIGIVVGGTTLGITTLLRTSASANDAARANVLVNGFSDAVKDLDYVSCEQAGGDPMAIVDAYNAAFEAREDGMVETKRLLRNGDTVEAESVDVVCNPDGGAQTISFVVESRSVSRTAQVTKRDLGNEGGLQAEFTADLVTAGKDLNNGAPPPYDDGDPLARFELDATSSTPQTRIVTYIFECDSGGSDPISVSVDTPTSELAFCEFPAPSSTPDNAPERCTTSDAPIDDWCKKITLVVLDSFGRASATAVVPVALPGVARERPDPTLVISARCVGPDQDATVSGTPCTANPSREVAFDASASTVFEGRIVSYEWNFGDPNTGDSNKFISGSATASHTYSRSGAPFVVSLIVVDELGTKTAAAPVNVYIERPGPPPPVASFTFAPQPAVAEQTMRFDGTASRDASNNPVSSYLWQFGDGSTGSPEPRPRHTYDDPGTYPVTLTVTDGNGRSSTASSNVVIGELLPPNHPQINFRMTGLKGCILGFQWFGCRATATFAWTNGPSASDDALFYEIEMQYVSGVCFGFNDETRQVRAGAPGTAQTYVMTFTGASDVCPGTTYRWRARALRNSAEDGTFQSDFTPWATRRASS